MSVRGSKESYNAYQARLMSKRRLLARVEPRYRPFRDAAGFVLVRALEYLAWPHSQSYLKGKIYRLTWQAAARLEAGCFVELLKVLPPAGGRHPAAAGWSSLIPEAAPLDAQRDGIKRVEAVLKTLRRIPTDALRTP